MRSVVSHPKLLSQISEIMYESIIKPKILDRLNENSGRNVLCGVPYSALTFATALSIKHEFPMLIARKEQKQYGTGKLIEGLLEEPMNCIVIEDVITSGASITEVVAKLVNEKFVSVKDAVVFFNRQQIHSDSPDCDILLSNGVRVHSVLNITQFVEILHEKRCIGSDVVDSIKQYIEGNQIKLGQTVSKPNIKELSYGQRAELLKSLPSAKENFAIDLFELMESKQSNLSVACDVEDQDELLELAEQVGPEVVMLKTHIDILRPSKTLTMQQFADKLTQIAEKHKFFIFEDRKFADIGSVTKQQYVGGPFDIAKWAHVTNCHLVSGTSSVVKGIQEGAQQVGKRRGLLLIAKMSTSDTLTNEDTEKVAVEVAQKHFDFVSGFICQGRLEMPKGNENDWFKYVYCTPGVQLDQKGDNLGQQYNTPQHIVGVKKSDLIIVGRGIYKQQNRAEAACLYRKQGWSAYLERLE
ncbi:uridine mono phosphate synthetase [Acrasis kona]|uniref:Uridine 5'-monophosphate synthase n=1 Tax=Acrasis kona TaxID=1008807 RepID=A0AAW2ZGX7_9EUKA